MSPGMGPALLTVTVTAAAVVVLPAASRAVAEMVWEPLVTPVVFQLSENGEAVSSAPWFTPSTRNCTPAKLPASDALAVKAVEPDTVAPATGALIDTVG